MLATETRQASQIVLGYSSTGSVNDLKNLEEGTVLKLIIKPHSDDAEINFIAIFCGLYTGEGCPQLHKDCCIMFQVIDFDCSESLVPWLKRTYPNLLSTGYQFRHLEDFYSIHILPSITIRAEVIKNLYKESYNLKNRLAKIQEVIETLKNISA